MLKSEKVDYQAEVFLELSSIIQSRKVPNAFIFSGPENSRRKEAALFLAKGLNCPESSLNSCNECVSCRKIDAGLHPDVLVIRLEKGKKTISISQIREMGEKISLKANEARFRALIISDAETMNIQAQNALLKMLEEPPEKTLFILITKTTESFLATVISRCRLFHFKSLGNDEIKNMLIHEFGMEADNARIISGTLGPDYQQALGDPSSHDQNTENQADWAGRRKFIIDSIKVILTGNSPIQKSFVLADAFSRDPDHIEENLNIMKTVFRDLAIFKFHPENIVNLDFFDFFEDITRKTESDFFLNWLDLFLETEKKISANSSPRLSLENFFLEIDHTKENIHL